MQKNTESTSRLRQIWKQHLLTKKLLVVVAYFTLVFIFAYFHIPCWFLTLFHIPCPGCGMSRAWLSVLHLDFKAAFSYHAMFWAMPLMAIYFFTDGHLFTKKIDRAMFWLILIGFAVNWIVHVCFSIF